MKTKACLFASLCLSLALSTSANAANYCLAIRGNGENEPAHWGAVAKVVENLGLPSAQAGGSSASITMLLIDAIATNPLVNNPDAVDMNAVKDRAALLVKSLQGFMTEVTNTPQWRDFMTLYKRSQEIKNPKWMETINSVLQNASAQNLERARSLITENKDLILANYKTGVQLGLISQKSYLPLYDAIERLTSNPRSDQAFVKDLKIATFYASELYHTLSVFGSFNAQTDDNLFFRPGIVDFDRLAETFGRVADFYAMTNPAQGEVAMWRDFLIQCTRASHAKSWSDFTQENPACGKQFSQLFGLHFKKLSQSTFVAHSIGVTIPSFPTTSVLVNSAHKEAQEALAAYAQALDPHFGKNFKLSQPEDIRFGYFGREDYLAHIQQNIGQRDEKSRRFLNLGQTSWLNALKLSPAEPGLSPFRGFVANGEPMTSAGGWSDLHPVLVLKAAGCENVVYVTRRGGESLFGQGVAKRLLGFTRDWSKMSTSSDDAKKMSAILNNNGDPSEQNTLWAKLYNLANPNSSFKNALRAADAVLCTNWDGYEISHGISGMIENAYTSPFYIPATSRLGEAASLLQPRLDTTQQNPEGYPEFAGCY